MGSCCGLTSGSSRLVQPRDDSDDDCDDDDSDDEEEDDGDDDDEVEEEDTLNEFYILCTPPIQYIRLSITTVAM